jgi:hypothetical protein
MFKYLLSLPKMKEGMMMWILCVRKTFSPMHPFLSYQDKNHISFVTGKNLPGFHNVEFIWKHAVHVEIDLGTL